nr:hypothetical protein [Tanacetum cinerariifolium]
MVDIIDDENLVDYDGDDEEPEEEPKEEPEQQIGHGNQFAQHLNPQPSNMNGWLEEDDDVNENVNDEDIEDEDVEVESPRDESSDSASSDSESEDKEADIAPEPTAGTVAQRPFAIRDFQRGIVEVGESFAARDSSYVGGLAPWGFATENATLKKKLAEKEMQLVIAHMDHASTEQRLHESIRWNQRFYMEMVRNGAVPKPSSEDENTKRSRMKSKKTSSDGTKGPSEPRGPPNESTKRLRKKSKKPSSDGTEGPSSHMRKIIRDQVAASMAEFMANMNHGADGAGAGGAEAGGAKADGSGAGGTKAGGAGAGGAKAGGAELVVLKPVVLKPMVLKLVVPDRDCKEKDKVKFATATLQDRALTWWNGRIASMGIDAANGTQWTKVRKWITEEFCPRKPKQVKVEQYIRGLSKNIRGDVTSSRPADIDMAVCMAYQLMGQIIQDKTDEAPEGEKRKGKGDHGGRGDNRRDYNHRQNQRRANAGAMTNSALNDNEVYPNCKNKKHAEDCWKCGKYGKLGHKTAACRCLDRKDVTSFNCNEKGHLKRDCPKLKKNRQDGNNRGAVYKLGAVDAQQDLKVVTGTFLLNNRYVTALFDSGTDKSFVSTKFSTLIDIEPVELDTFYDVELADGKVLSRYDVAILCGKRKARKYIKNGCELFLAQVTKQGSKEKRLEDVLVIQDFPEAFLNELPGLPPPRQVEFRIDLIPSAVPVARAPYHLAPSEMKEFSEKLRELSE